ncbi:hypothetical protein CK203_030148 [Vitis vinifera]|uniref:Uncharacterized protein n=1 Tax=Vitis vinifera TaxID=29760 RepID=A0A438I5P2_VITVI|nr:hypothetical protein CK203_030148 [Vitis vinifera]
MHPPMMLLAIVRDFRGTVPLINDGEIFSVVMMTIGVSRSTIILRMAVKTMVMGGGPWLLVVIAYYPGVYALPASFALPWIGEAETALFGTYLFATVIPLVAFAGSLNLVPGFVLDKSLAIVCLMLILLWLCGKKWLQKRLFRLSGPGERGAAMPTEKGGKNAILFTKEQFNAGLRFPLPALFKEFLHFSQIPPIFIHPNLVRVLMGCSIINMLVSAHLPSLQMVTELPDSTKGGAKGLVAVWGGWAGLSQHPSRPFSPNYTLKIPGLELRGHLVDWVEKASFACVVREPQEYVINILPRKLAKDEIVPGEHYTVKELPLYQEAKEADAERRRKLLEDRDQKKLKALSGRLPDRSGVRTLLQRKLQEKGEAGEEAWEG